MADDVRTPQVLSAWSTIEERYEQLYRDLHRHPEVSFQETRTAATAADVLATQGFDVSSGVGGTGVVGVLDSGPGPTVLLRAELDALPITEETGLPFASTRTAEVDGETRGVMHACGHDLHIAAVLAATDLLARAPSAWSGRVVAVLQPAEEIGQGALAMLDDGLAEVIGAVDVAFAQHVMALPSGKVYLRPGAALSASTTMRVTVYGHAAHASVPQASIDAAVLASMIVVRLQTVVSRETSPHDFAVLTVGTIRAGSVANAIAHDAVLELSLRSYTNSGLQHLVDAVRRTVLAESQASRATREPDIEVVDGFPLTDNDPDTTERLQGALRTHLGDAVGPLPQQAASEDFANIPDAFGIPYCYWGVGALQHEHFEPDSLSGERAPVLRPGSPTNHAPTFAPQLRPALELGTTALVVATMEWLGEEGR